MGFATVHHPIWISKTITFTGAADLGAIGNVPLLNVTGEIEIDVIVGFCTTDLVGATATLSLGITNSTAFFIAATLATDLDANDFWIDATPEANGVLLLVNVGSAITQNIIGTVATAAITGGVLRIDIYWRPLSSDGNIVAV